MNAGEICSTCRFWHEPLAQCRRYPPVMVACGEPDRAAETACWPRTAADHWCGEWSDRANGLPFIPEPELDPEEERWLRNASAAQALLVLPEEKRDQLLCEILTDEERECPTPPADFHERVQQYLARRPQDHRST